MAKPSVFYSFHFDNDVFRVQLIRNMHVLAGKEPVEPNAWEQIRKSDQSIQRWIDTNMAEADAVVVLIGKDTYSRPWVKYEIQQAWRTGKPLLGVHIHNLDSMGKGGCAKGRNPFDHFTYQRNGKPVDAPPAYDPHWLDAYNDIAKNLPGWVSKAMRQ